MRPTALLIACICALASCRSASHESPVSEEPPEREVVLKAAAGELAAGRMGVAEEFLCAAGQEATPWVRPLLASANSDVRLAAQAILLSAGEDLGLSSEEEVDLILFDLARAEAHPFAGIRALDRLHRLGDGARPALEAAEARGGRRGEVARRLLDRMAESP